MAINVVRGLFEAFLEDDNIPVELGKALASQKAGGGYVLPRKVLVERPQQRREEEWLFFHPVNNPQSILPHLSETSRIEVARIIQALPATDIININPALVLDSAIKTEVLISTLSAKEPVFLTLPGGSGIRLVLSRNPHSPHSLEYYSCVVTPEVGVMFNAVNEVSLSRLDFPTLFLPVLLYETYSAQKVSILQALGRQAMA